MNIKKWFKISLVNFAIVAVIGVIMRYKIGFPFPFFDQKNLQHGHSHFAFTGWVSQSIMLFMIATVQNVLKTSRVQLYKWLLGLNLATAYLMLFSFIQSGYNPLSIVFSSLSLLIGLFFVVIFSIDLAKIKNFEPKKWFYTALAMYVFSSLGTVALSYMMATKNITQTNYLTAVYWYLHFQYNGWFFFACAGLMIHYFNHKINLPVLPKRVFRLFALSCVPAFGLSILWMHLPIWAIIIIGAAAACQLVAWFSFLHYCYNNNLFKRLSTQKIGKLLYLFVSIAITIKLSLQMVSVVPSISILTFGFRSIVIAYLHLVLLGIISTLLLTYALQNEYLTNSEQTSNSILLLLFNITIYEFILGIQGVASFGYHNIPNIDIFLVFFAVAILVSVVLVLVSQVYNKRSVKI